MRILLDESLRQRLRSTIPAHEVVTVAEAGWSGVQNGELLQLAAAAFDLFVTADQNLQYQQNLASLPLAVAVLVAGDNRLATLRPLAVELSSLLSGLRPRTLVRIGGRPGG